MKIIELAGNPLQIAAVKKIRVNWIEATLFGIGRIVLGSLLEGLVMLAIAVVAFSWIARSFREEPATLAGVGVAA